MFRIKRQEEGSNINSEIGIIMENGDVYLNTHKPLMALADHSLSKMNALILK
jgi:hypothetical protein